MRTYPDRADTRPAATVRDTERLVQIQVADVAAELAGSRQTHECIEIRTVDVHLPAGVVHGTADVLDLVFVHAMGRRVGDHDRGEPFGVVGDLRPQIVEVHVTVRAARNDLDTHTGHDSRCGVGPMRARGDQARVAVVVTAAQMIVPNGQQTCIFTLATGIRLQGDGVVSGDCAEPAFEIRDECPDSLGLICRSERVQARELRPRDGFHLRRSV